MFVRAGEAGEASTVRGPTSGHHFPYLESGSLRVVLMSRNALYKYVCDCFFYWCPEVRRISLGQAGSGKGALGKVDQHTELLFRPLPQGGPRPRIGCSGVPLAEAPSRHRRLSVQASREELLLPLDCCPLPCVR